MKLDDRFNHYYQQYLHHLSEADRLYRRVAVWLTFDTLLVTAAVALLTSDESQRFWLDPRSPMAIINALVMAVFIAAAFVFAILCLVPRQYARFSLPHEIEEFCDDYSEKLQAQEYSFKKRVDAVDQVSKDELCKVLATHTRTNADINERRAKQISKSSVCSVVSLVFVVLLLVGSVIQSYNPGNHTERNQDMTATERDGQLPPPDAPPSSGTITKGG